MSLINLHIQATRSRLNNPFVDLVKIYLATHKDFMIHIRQIEPDKLKFIREIFSTIRGSKRIGNYYSDEKIGGLIQVYKYARRGKIDLVRTDSDPFYGNIEQLLTFNEFNKIYKDSDQFAYAENIFKIQKILAQLPKFLDIIGLAIYPKIKSSNLTVISPIYPYKDYQGTIFDNKLVPEISKIIKDFKTLNLQGYSYGGLDSNSIKFIESPDSLVVIGGDQIAPIFGDLKSNDRYRSTDARERDIVPDLIVDLVGITNLLRKVHGIRIKIDESKILLDVAKIYEKMSHENGVFYKIIYADEYPWIRPIPMEPMPTFDNSSMKFITTTVNVDIYDIKDDLLKILGENYDYVIKMYQSHSEKYKML